jgi:hypothetical protein
LEHVDYSICTLEFESRRESYFWVLEALDLYRPKVRMREEEGWGGNGGRGESERERGDVRRRDGEVKR